MDRNETLSGIVGKIRRAYKLDGVTGSVIVPKFIMLELADRIEAAVKRETVAGDTAKLREALEYAREVLVLNGFVEPVVRCDAALAAPPRNCDRFPTYVDAVAYFNKHNQPLRADPRPNLIDGKKYEDFSEWYADTAPQEGGKP